MTDVRLEHLLTADVILERLLTADLIFEHLLTTDVILGQFDKFLNRMLIFFLQACASVGGIMVSIAAFQAVDPGSIPGRRIFFVFTFTIKRSATKCCSACRDQDSNLGYCGHNAGS